ncbi:putative pectinesterase/pectinesterase inhibitor 36 [Forsythia ovata]|uniref:Pectinesterase n=1 Tax=Forsythia ovata TaxID=205694 RepID=A0ABD1QP15_9LAMI
MAHSGILHAIKWAQGLHMLHGSGSDSGYIGVAIGDCVKLYEEAEPRLARLMSGESGNCSQDDAITWLSAVLASHNSCLDGLKAKRWGFVGGVAESLTAALRGALAVHRHGSHARGKRKGFQKRPNSSKVGGILASWNAATSKADLVVAQDGSGNYKTINEAVAALARVHSNRPKRTVVYVKSGVYHEKVEIRRDLKNVMFVGDGMDKTIVTGNQNVQDGSSTLSSSTFGVSSDGFWARDMTFENSAGPQKHQAVALSVGSDQSVFYRCSFKGYQDTLLVHSLRQFYRDCQIYGTIDFIFGDAAAVFQNCDIFLRRPMDHQSNMITAQGRDDPNENTGILIVNSRVAPASDFRAVKGKYKNYLGRPWKKFSRTVFLKTYLGGFVDQKGWKEWSGDFAISTLYYAEYMNTGIGASTENRVKWPGFHVLREPWEVSPFTVNTFIQGDLWIPATGVPYWAEI